MIVSKKIKRIFFILKGFFLCFVNTAALAQEIEIEILNDKGEAISYVNVIDENGVILGTTSLEGTLLVEKNTANKISLNHPLYERKVLNKIENKKYYLKLKENTLEEIVLSGNKKEYDYIILKGFFRSYQTENAIAKYYSDGIVEYYIPNSKKEEKIKRNVIAYRVFENDSIKKEKKVIAVSIENFGLPYLSKNTLNNNEKSTALDITHNNNSITLSKELVEKKKTLNLIGYQMQIISNIKIEEHNSNKMPSSQKNLIKSTQYIHQKIKHKKEDEFNDIESIYEFYLLEKSGCSKNDLKKRKKEFMKFNKAKSFYQIPYWKKTPKTLSLINENLYRILKEKKNAAVKSN